MAVESCTISIFSAAFPGILVYVLFWLLTPEEEPSNPSVIVSR